MKRMNRDVMEMVKLVAVPIAVVSLLSAIFLLFIGGTDLLRFAAAQLLTAHGIFRAAIVVVGVLLVTLGRHLLWYRDEKPAMWFRHSAWTNAVEVLVLVLISVIGVWAILRFAPALPSR